MAPVVLELQRHPELFETRLCATAQHREMLDDVLRLFELAPDYDLDIMRVDQSLTDVTVQVLARLDPILKRDRPDWLLVQGDTTTAMAASLVAFYHRIRIGHVEAGLRTGNKFHPYPEEVNRIIADAIGDLRFAPTESARRNLLREGISGESIHVTGNTVIDALTQAASLPADADAVQLFDRLGLDHAPGESNGKTPRIILVTAHRRENFGERLENICNALCDIAGRYPVKIVYPVHPNPNVRRTAYGILGNIPNVLLLDPLGYGTMVQLMKRSHLVLTDSGGLQEEAPGLGKPVLVMRDVTERPEAVEAGTVRVVGTDYDRIVKETALLLEDDADYLRMATAVNPYGDGHASERIAWALASTAGERLQGVGYPPREWTG
jgi:UDP-N-acetylglucosamine 2-epimerase (non-hydrolysing)